MGASAIMRRPSRLLLLPFPRDVEVDHRGVHVLVAEVALDRFELDVVHEQVARAVLTNSPFVRCFLCLSAQVGMLEKNVREAAQPLIVHYEFFVDRRVCQVCGHADKMLVSGKAP
jgi:hypothetical protein